MYDLNKTMSDYIKKFSYGDTVSRIRSKTGLLQYGVVYNYTKMRIPKDHVYVVWHPNGTIEAVLANKVCCL